MARLDARWDNFWQRGQIWYRFDEDGPSGPSVIESSFSASALVARVWESSFSADALVSSTISGSFGASALFSQVAVSSFSLDAVIAGVSSGSFFADSLVQATQSGSFDLSADIAVVQVRTGSFSLDAYVSGERSGSFDLSAIVSRTTEASATASALVLVEQSGTFDASALVLSVLTGSIGADAWIDYGFYASALFLKVQTASFGISARIRELEYFTPHTVDYEHPVAVVSVTPTASTLVYAPSHGFVDRQYVYLDVPGLPVGIYQITYVDVDNFIVVPTVPAYATGGTAYGASPGDKIVIAIDAEDITTDVMYDRTEFVSQANGQAGTCHIVILDRGRTQSFTTGQRIYVTVNDLRLWTGYVMRVKRTYPFIAHSPAERTIEIEGLDVNVLFQKRFVFNKTDPTNGEGPESPPYTDDTTVLAQLFDDYLDLSGDDLDTYSLITNVGTINENQKDYSIKPGEAWGESMRRIGTLLSPIWGINPDRQVFWADVDVEDAPFELSDNPAPGQVGVANLNIIKDGTSIINDVLLVAAGPGPITTPVYKRLSDATSIADHNRSQFGALIANVWRQATIDRVASSYINGSPQSLRGHKDDKVSVTCTVFQHGLRVGHKVRVVAGAWGFDDIVPIRQLRLRWVTPSEPRYDLTITHDLDTSWSLFDPYNPRINVPGTKVIQPRPPKPDRDEVGGCECGVTDDFNREPWGEGTAMGTSSSGYAWAEWTPYFEVVDGGYLRAEFPGGAEGTGQANLSITARWQQISWEYDIQFHDGSYGFPESSLDSAYFELGAIAIVYDSTIDSIAPDNLLVSIAGVVFDPSYQVDTNISRYTRVKVKGSFDGSTYSVWVWPLGGSQPALPTATYASSEFEWGLPSVGDWISLYSSGGAATGGEGHALIDNLDIFGVDKCARFRVFDDFWRVEEYGFGTASSGPEWTPYETSTPLGVGNWSVPLGQAFIGPSSGSDVGAGGTIWAPAPMSLTTDFVATFTALIVPSSDDAYTWFNLKCNSVGVSITLDSPFTEIVLTLRDGGLEPLDSVSIGISSWPADQFLRYECIKNGSMSSANVSYLDGTSIAALSGTISDPGDDQTIGFAWDIGFDPNARMHLGPITLDYDGMPCYEGGDPPGGDEAHGYICEDLTYSAVTTLTLAYHYVSYTVRVWINGELTTNFTETSPTSITLDSAPAPGSDVHVCYLVQTGLGDWSDSGSYVGGYIPI